MKGERPDNELDLGRRTRSATGTAQSFQRAASTRCGQRSHAIDGNRQFVPITTLRVRQGTGHKIQGAGCVSIRPSVAKAGLWSRGAI
jgi:hypothetical protein